MYGARFDAIRPLLEAQPYIKSCEWTWNSMAIKYDFSTFREQYQLHGNLAEQQARHVGVKIDLGSPWLSVSSPIPHGVAVIARSPRYHNPIFPWRRILSAFPERIFVGLPMEHKAFESSFGSIPFYPTKDLLELARVLAGARQVISNQTCAFWISVGLGQATIQETMSRDMNSIVERSNCRYTRDVSEVNSLIASLTNEPTQSVLLHA